MPGRYRSRIVPPIMSLAERVARGKGVYPESHTGWDIPFNVRISGRWIIGYLIANDLKLMIGLPGSFLVYWEVRFQGTISWTANGWIMAGTDPDLVVALGEWIVLWYE
jgi:hypothetical protein